MNGCKWCNAELYKEKYYGDFDFDMEQTLDGCNYTGLSMLWNSKINKFGICASGEGEVVANINYCPKCGRKL